jgi:multidrug transporter EmrE-like cation transporter
MGTPTIDAFLTNPWYLAGLGCLVLQALCWQIVVRAIQLFVAYIVSTGLNYLLILAASSVFFRERVSVWNVAGAALILIGTCLLVREGPP